MRQKRLAASLTVLLLSAKLFGQAPSANSAGSAVSSKTPSSHTAYYLDSLPPRLDLILPLPPSRESAITATELAELHRIETIRT